MAALWFRVSEGGEEMTRSALQDHGSVVATQFRARPGEETDGRAAAR